MPRDSNSGDVYARLTRKAVVNSIDYAKSEAEKHNTKHFSMESKDDFEHGYPHTN